MSLGEVRDCAEELGKELVVASLKLGKDVAGHHEEEDLSFNGNAQVSTVEIQSCKRVEYTTEQTRPRLEAQA